MQHTQRTLFMAVFLISLIVLMTLLLLYQSRLSDFDAALYATMTAIR